MNNLEEQSKDFSNSLTEYDVKEILKWKKAFKILKDYCYFDDFPDGEVIRMCCEEYEESNKEDFDFLKEVLKEYEAS